MIKLRISSHLSDDIVEKFVSFVFNSSWLLCADRHWWCSLLDLTLRMWNRIIWINAIELNLSFKHMNDLKSIKCLKSAKLLQLQLGIRMKAIILQRQYFISWQMILQIPLETVSHFQSGIIWVFFSLDRLFISLM
jgi:hypothetical protein